jgi:hypothetical protein
MTHFVVGLVVGACVAAGIAAPVILPWRFRVRYLANAPMGDPFLGLGRPPGYVTREVRAAEVEAHGRHVDLVLDEDFPGHGVRRTVLTSEACPPASVAALDGWMTLRTPLLLIIDEHGAVNLYGPNSAVTEFGLATENTR